MRVAGVNRLDADPHATVGERLHRAGEAFIGRLPAEEAAKEPHVGALAVVGGGERPSPVKLDEGIVEPALHEIASQPADPQGGSAVRARRPAHHRADDVVEDADEHGRSKRGASHQCWKKVGDLLTSESTLDWRRSWAAGPFYRPTSRPRTRLQARRKRRTGPRFPSPPRRHCSHTPRAAARLAVRSPPVR